MTEKKSLAIIGEGETEWFYFDSLRIACHYPFKVAPDFPQHSDIQHIAKLAEDYANRQYDYVVCLIDMDRLATHPKEMDTYKRIRKKSSKKILWIETNPCTEFWFLLHFLPNLTIKRYNSYEELLPELQHYMPGYEKTQRYFKRTNLYSFLTKHGDLNQALEYGAELSRLSEASPEDKIAYSQIHRVFELLSELSNKTDKTELKSQNQIRIGDKRQKIVDFIAENGISDSKSISKATGLKPSRLRDFLKELVENGILEAEGEYKNRRYKMK